MAPGVSLRRLALAALAGVALGQLGCGGSPTAPKTDEVFYLHTTGLIDKNESYEVYFPPLDAAESKRVPRMVGVGLFRGDLRMARPIDWSVRGADYTPGQRHISYQSPRQFVFSIHERVDHPEDRWPDVLRRYEFDLEKQGAQILAARMPMGTANTQGRGYLLKTRVPGKPDYETFSHEYVIRSANRLFLIQVVHAPNIEPLADEVMTAVSSILAY
jgi:hypothetical protein